ncbi:MAG: protein DpdJ [Dehalococcoidia bacterium]
MSISDNDALLEAGLEALERLEDPLLSWGVVDGFISEDEVEDALSSVLREADYGDDLDAVLDLRDAMSDAGLLVADGDLYRTRMAEHFRLLRSLRQLFHPRGDDGVGWRSAATLVDGLRYVRRPRRYPLRDVDASQLVENLTRAGSAERVVLRTLTSSPDGTPWKLAGFQERATRDILARLDGRKGGVIVGAGTGAGKTLAFYLPALTYVGSQVGGAPWTKVLALYPRNELLKDQLQSAVEQAVLLAPELAAANQPPIRVGALFGGVPDSNWSVSGRYGWRKAGNEAFRCDYLTCPEPTPSGAACGGALILTKAQLRRDEPALEGAECGHLLDPKIFAVTRDQLRRRPPDLLFSSTEMLNRAMLDPSMSPVVGLGASRSPALVLLDEVHTYGGTSGAMTGLTLRRWSARTATPPVFVGLSATLLDAQRFFGDLVGLHADNVSYVEPEPHEMVPEGAEYLAIVRADPTSKAAVLSTSIQVAMLTGRTMDRSSHSGVSGLSRGLFGTRTFLFTDDVDVTNRLYHDLLDAEGQRHGYPANKVIRRSLANLRETSHGEIGERRDAGQLWELAERIGHDLGPNGRLSIDRTYSADAGFREDADVIVATASLEVGVDDEAVGAVMQHKAPRDPAAFLQRKGRAGRRRGTRPLTTVVVSDYGRDREAYERWDRLVDPVLEPSTMPVGNVHVLRMQAALATIGWIAEREQAPGVGNFWEALRGPARRADRQAAQVAARAACERLLDDRHEREALARHLMAALDVPRRTVDDLLWRPPRPVLLGAVPSLLRRLQDEWAQAGSDAPEDAGARQPLPDFVPSALFAQLTLPEVSVQLPNRPFDDDPRTEQMGIIQAIRELAPGRVTKRFALSSSLDRAWVEPLDGTQDLDGFVPLRQQEGSITVDGEELPLWRPLRVVTTQPAQAVRDSSHGRPTWVSEMTVPGAPMEISLPSDDSVGRLLGTLALHLHRDHNHVEARRGASSYTFETRWDDGSERTGTLVPTDQGSAVALGAIFDVDGLRITPNLPSTDNAWLDASGRSLRMAWFIHRAVTSKVLLERTSTFNAERLADLIVLTLLGQGEASLPQAFYELHERFAGELRARIGLLLGRTGVIEGDVGGGRLGQELGELLEDEAVITELRGLAQVLWDPGEEAEEWLRQRMLRTCGEALLAGAKLLCPEHDPEGLYVDVEPGDDHGVVWVTEREVGGGGFLEALADAAGANPSRFVRLVNASLRPGPDDLVAGALERVIRVATEAGTEMEAAFRTYRSAAGAKEQAAGLEAVREALESLGQSALPATVDAVANRLLRRGSDGDLDRRVASSLDAWHELERSVDVEIPVRIWTLLDAADGIALDEQLHDRLQVVLWPRGSSVRDRRLSTYNPFDNAPSPAPGVLLGLLVDDDQGGVTASDGWATVAESLARRSSVTVNAPPGEHDALLDILVDALVAPVDLGYLRLHATTSEIRMGDEGAAQARLDLPSLGRLGGAPESFGQNPSGLRTRRIHTSGSGSAAVADVLHAVFASELIQPSAPLWIVSAWLSDVTVLDNRGGELLSIAPALPIRHVRLVETITELVSRGGDVRVVVRDDPHNRPVVSRLRALEERTTAGRISVAVRRDLHDKIIATRRLLVEGSMNLTHRGAAVNEEGVRLVADPADVSQQRLELAGRFQDPQ